MHGLSYDLSPPYSIQWEVSGVSMISSYHTILHMSPIYIALSQAVRQGSANFWQVSDRTAAVNPHTTKSLFSRASWYSPSSLMQVHILIYIVTTCYRVHWMCMYGRHWSRGRRHLLQMSCSWLDASGGVVVTNTVWLQAVDLSFYCELDIVIIYESLKLHGSP